MVRFWIEKEDGWYIKDMAGGTERKSLLGEYEAFQKAARKIDNWGKDFVVPASGNFRIVNFPNEPPKIDWSHPGC